MINKYLIGLLVFAAALCGRPAAAQSLGAFKGRLARPAATPYAQTPATVTVTEYGDAAEAVAEASRSVRTPALKAYRVCIFSDNARAGAAAAKELFEETFPGTPVYMFYENPYFRVTVGNCLTLEEAIILKGRVSGTFPKAFPKSEPLSLRDFRY